MKLFHKSHDGGNNSGVTGYWLIEYQMHMQYKDTVTAASQIAIYLAWTCHSASCVSFIDQ